MDHLNNDFEPKLVIFTSKNSKKTVSFKIDYFSLVILEKRNPIKVYIFWYNFECTGKVSTHRILIVSWFECLVQSGKNNTLKSTQKVRKVRRIMVLLF